MRHTIQRAESGSHDDGIRRIKDSRTGNEGKGLAIDARGDRTFIRLPAAIEDRRADAGTVKGRTNFNTPTSGRGPPAQAKKFTALLVENTGQRLS